MNVDFMSAVPPETAENTRTVLVVEDDFLTRWSTSDYLRERGYHVIEATDAADAISVFACRTPVNAVFSDINMPGEMTGHDLAEWLETHHPRVPILLTSGAAPEGSKVAASETRLFIGKPYALPEVENCLLSMLA
jgi:two-component system, response regulator PdtaR